MGRTDREWLEKYLDDKFVKNDLSHSEIFRQLLSLQKEVSGIKATSKIKMTIVSLMSGSVGAAALGALFKLL